MKGFETQIRDHEAFDSTERKKDCPAMKGFETKRNKQKTITIQA